MAGKRTKRKNQKKRKTQGKPKGTWTAVSAQELQDEGIPVRPIFERPGRVITPEQNQELRRSFMVWQEGWLKQTPKSTRPNLNDLETVDVVNMGGLSIPQIGLVGSAAYMRQFPNGTVRLMLSAPMALGKDKSAILIDDHIWLDLSNCYGVNKKSIDVHYGDMFIIQGSVEAYEHKGMRRLGIGRWAAIDSFFEYTDTKHKRIRRIPNIFGDEFLMLRIEEDKPEPGKIAHAAITEEELNKRLLELSKVPNYGENFYYKLAEED